MPNEKKYATVLNPRKSPTECVGEHSCSFCDTYSFCLVKIPSTPFLICKACLAQMEAAINGAYQKHFLAELYEALGIRGEKIMGKPILSPSAAEPARIDFESLWTGSRACLRRVSTTLSPTSTTGWLSAWAPRPSIICGTNRPSASIGWRIKAQSLRRSGDHEDTDC